MEKYKHQYLVPNRNLGNTCKIHRLLVHERTMNSSKQTNVKNYLIKSTHVLVIDSAVISILTQFVESK